MLISSVLAFFPRFSAEQHVVNLASWQYLKLHFVEQLEREHSSRLKNSISARRVTVERFSS